MAASTEGNLALDQDSVLTRLGAAVRTRANAMLAVELDLFGVLASWTAVIAVRTVLELLLDSQHLLMYFGGTHLDLLALANAYVSWVTTFVVLALVVRAFAPVTLQASVKLVTLLSPLIWIVPLTDFVVTRGQGREIFYGFDWSDFAYNLFYLFDPRAHIAMVPPGVRLEIFVVVVAAVCLAPAALAMSWRRGVCLALGLYFAIFGLGYLPAAQSSVLAAAGWVGASSAWSPLDFFILYLAPLALAVGAAVWLDEDARTPVLARWIFFPSRLLFYLLLTVLGFLVTGHGRQLAPEHWQKLAVGCVAVALLFGWARVLNDVHDIDIDRISNRGRPIITGQITAPAAARLATALLLLAFLFAIAAGAGFLILLAACAGLAYVYSAPPLRLRRFYPAGHLVLTGIGALVFTAGASLIFQEELYFELGRSGVVGHVMLGFFLLVHLKDLKDREGDKRAGVQNVFNQVSSPRAFVLVIVAAFAVTAYFAMAKQGIGTEAAVLLSVFVVVSTLWVVRARELEKLERLLWFALATLGVLSGLWLRGVWLGAL